MFINLRPLIVLTLVLSAATVAVGSTWPKDEGVYVAKTAKDVPAFPAKLTGFQLVRGEDYFGDEAATTGKVTIDEGGPWEMIDDFPSSQIHCRDGVYTLRWHVSDPAVKVDSAYENTGSPPPAIRTGSFGYIYGSSCTWPRFRFPSADGKYGDRSVDVLFEVRYWRAD